MRDSLQDLRGGGRIVRGSVSSSGGISAGTGFSAVKNSTGSYTVTFLQSFKTPPIVVAVTVSGYVCRVETTTASTVGFSTFNTSAALADQALNFVAIEATG